MRIFILIILICLLTLFWIPHTYEVSGGVEGGEKKVELTASQPSGKAAGNLQIVTAYSKLETCPESECITASGIKPHEGGVACPRSVNLGSQVAINNEVYVCNDRTNEKYEGRYDIWFGDDYEGALEFGIQKLEVLIVD